MLTFIWFIWLPGTQGNLILGVWLTSLPAKMTSLNVFTNCTTNSRLPLLGITRFLLSNRIRNFKFSKPSSFLRVQRRAPRTAAASTGRPDPQQQCHPPRAAVPGEEQGHNKWHKPARKLAASVHPVSASVLNVHVGEVTADLFTCLMDINLL